MARQHHHDTPPAAPRRDRCRAFAFARHSDRPMTPRERAQLAADLDELGGRYIFVEHVPVTESEAGRPHAQGAIGFENPREQSEVERRLEGFKVVKLTGRGALARYADYLRHDGIYDDSMTASFDWRAEVSKLPASRPPRLKDITARVIAGELTADEVGRRWPQMYLGHRARFEAAEQLGRDQRAERRDAERRAERRAAEAEKVRAWLAAEAAWKASPAGRAYAAEEAAIVAWLDAKWRWKASPEGVEYLRHKVAVQQWLEAEQRYVDGAAARAQRAARLAADRAMWAVAYVATDAGITGGAAARRAGVARLLGTDPTPAACVAHIVAEWGGSTADAEAEIRQFRDDIEAVNFRVGILLGHATSQTKRAGEKGDPIAFEWLLAHQRRHRAYPDLYDAVAPHPSMAKSWAAELRTAGD